MKLDSVGEVIATRRLKLLHHEEPLPEVLLLLGKPRQLPNHTDYYCPYQIKGAGSEKVRYSCGLDTLQVLQLAIQTLGVEVEVLNKQLGGTLRWDGDEKGWLGFSAP